MTDKKFKFICDEENCYFKKDDKVLDCIEVVDLLNALKKENEQLKTRVTAYLQDIEVFKEHNTQLQLRNNRQAETISELYNLIEKEDWESLKQIMQDLKDCDEQLQREWKCYDD